MVFLAENVKSKHYHHWILHIRISIAIKFPLNWQLWFFGPNLPKKSISGRKQKNEHPHWILHIRNSLSTKFCLQLTISIFWTKFFKNKKSKDYHWILHIQIRLGAIFLGAMALLGQSRESWPSMAPLGRVENSQSKILWHF